MSAIQITRTTRPSMEAMLSAAGFGAALGGSARGWSAIKRACQCWRAAYYSLIKGLQPSRPSDALDIGVLYHACMEMHFTTAGQRTYEPLIAVEREAPQLAWNVRRAVDARMAKYAAEEAHDWDVRAVEYEVINHVKGVPTAGKYAGREIKAPISSKFDLVIARGRDGGPSAPFGPVPQGVWVYDHKTTSRMSRDKTRGFGMDAQLNLMALNWRLAGFENVFGKLNGFVLEIVVWKGKDVGLQRLEVQVTDEDVDRFQEFITPWAVELESMLAADDREDQTNWPVNFGGCQSQYGACSYWDLCESHGRMESQYIRPPNFVPARGLVRQEF